MDDLKKIDDTKNKIDEQLQKIEALRQPFQEQITQYDEKIKSINDQINNINAFLEESCSKLPNGERDEDIQKFKAKKTELESLLPGFIEQKKL